MPDRPTPHVLLVDDTPANLVALEALLEGLACQLVSAGSGNEALRQLLRHDFAVMLLDVQMPEIDGYEVARYARGNPATRDVPIIFLTAMHSSEDGILRGYGTGAVDFLLKPINPRVLRGKVQVFLDLHEGRRRLTEEIDAHKKTLGELQLANAALRHFTSAASHDLREPLRSMQGFLQALAEEAGERLEPQARDYLERSRRASQRMAALLDSLLAYAGLQRAVAWLEVDCQSVAGQVEADLAARIASSQAIVTFGQLPRITGDPSRIYQLFLNLIGNAIKFHRPGQAPRVTVSAERRGREWLFCVEDQGVGIEPEHQSMVFVAFRRLHGQQEFEGSGLGLTICKQIVEQHGGRIWLESEAGQGSKMWFSLAEAPAAAGASVH
jgi:two-component system, sensor histidine kinase and response regulator